MTRSSDEKSAFVALLEVATAALTLYAVWKQTQEIDSFETPPGAAFWRNVSIVSGKIAKVTGGLSLKAENRYYQLIRP